MVPTGVTGRGRLPDVIDGPGQGNRSFARVYDDHLVQVFRFLSYRTSSRDLAEDLTQVTFEKALRAWPRYDPRKGAVLTWLLAIARNVLIDHLRADRGDVRLDDERAQTITNPDEPRLGPSSELASALSVLSDREREILGLRFGADLQGPEIAALTGLTLANVQQILSRSLRKLRSQLEPDGPRT